MSELRYAKLAIVLAVLACAQAVAQDSPTAPTFADIVRSEPLEVQRQKITTLAEKGMVFGEQSLPEAFDLLQTGKALHNYIDAFDEPLAPTRVAALERLVKSNKDADAKFRAAVLLYRHGVGAGREFLVAKLAEQRLEAARILAMNQEPGLEQQVVDAIVASHDRSDEALAVASKWLSDQQRHAILDSIRNQGWQTPYAIAFPLLATQADHPRLKEDFIRAQQDSSQKFYYAAGLARLGDNEALTFLKDQLNRIGMPDQPSKRYFIFQAAAHSEQDSLVDDLRQALGRCARPVNNETDQQKRRRRENIVNALEAIIDLNGTVNDDLVLATFAAFEGSKDPKLISAFLRLKSELAATLVRALIGEEEFQRVDALLKLRPVPQEYLPRDSRPWVR
jgi:hypothetical protein